MSNYSKGISSALLAVLALSSYSILAKVLLENLIPETLAGFAQLFSVIAILLCFGFLPELKKIHRLPKKHLALLASIAILSSVIAPLLLFTGLKDTTATNSVILGRLEAVFVGIISFIWLKERISRHQVFGIVLMFIGVILIVTQNFQTSLTANPGDLYIIASGLVWACSVCIFKKNIHHVSPELVVLIRNGVGAIFLFFIIPLLFPISHDYTQLLNKEILIPILIFSLFVIVFGQIMWYKTLELIPATIASSTSLLAPLIGVALAVVILGESLYFHHLTGGVAILIGLCLTVLHHQKHPHHHKIEKTKHWNH
jgi:drug/metabolite transporter (DMT)-like permease